MKKLLLLSVFLTLGIVYCFGQTNVEVTEVFYPKSSFTGMTKKNQTFSKQTISSDPKTIIIGNNNGTIGRGYLEFDISNIPKNATIQSAKIQLTSKIVWDSNFNGKIKIEQALQEFNEYGLNQVMWNMMLPVGEIPYTTFTIANEGYGYLFEPYYLKDMVKDKIKNQRSLGLTITHTNESKIVRLSGSQQDLYLEVSYKVSDPTNPGINPPTNPGGGESSECNTIMNKSLYDVPRYIYPGIPFKIGRNNCYSYPIIRFDKIKFSFDKTLFSWKQINDHCIELTLKPIIDNTYTDIIVEAIENDGALIGKTKNKYTWRAPIYGSPAIVKDDYAKDVVCAGETAAYKIKNYHNYTDIDSVTVTNVEWLNGTNMTLTNPDYSDYLGVKYRVSGHGYGTVKARITQKNGRSYIIENSGVWVGAPPKPTGINGIPSYGLEVNTTYLLSPNHTYGNSVEKYYWNPLAGNGKPGYSKLVPSSNNNIDAYLYTGSTKNQLAIMLSVRAENKCGVSPFYILPLTSNGPTSPEPFSMLKSSHSLDKDLYDIRIYNFSTGQIVYQEKKTVDFSIENTTLKQGIYIIELTDENGNITRTKVMKK